MTDYIYLTLIIIGILIVLYFISKLEDCKDNINKDLKIVFFKENIFYYEIIKDVQTIGGPIVTNFYKNNKCKDNIKLFTIKVNIEDPIYSKQDIFKFIDGQYILYKKKQKRQKEIRDGKIL